MAGQELALAERGIEPWLAFPNESADKYAYFQMYRDRPPEERDRGETTDEIAEFAGVNERTVRDWKLEWRWRERALAFDVQRDKRAIQQLDQQQTEYRVQQTYRLRKFGDLLDEMIDRAMAMRVERTQTIEDEDNPGVMIQIVDRALDTQNLSQLVRSLDQYDRMWRRLLLLPVNTTAKHLEEAALDLDRPRRRVTLREAIIEDADGFD